MVRFFDQHQGVNMLSVRFKMVLRNTAFSLAAALAAVGSAQAAVYQGSWDPTYGNIFPNLGWKATALFDVPNACLAQGNGTYTESGACANFSVLSASVSFYNIANSSTILETFNLDTSVGVSGISITNHQFSGIATGYFDSFVPSGASATIAGNSAYAFSLILLGGNQAQLIYATPITTSPGCITFPVSGSTCGASTNPAAATFTAVVPEPETYALMLAGLGVLGLVARRRRV